MKAIRLFGAVLLVLSGYLINMLISSDWSVQQQLILGGAVAMLLYLGLAGVLTNKAKSFGDYLVNTLIIWPL